VIYISGDRGPQAPESLVVLQKYASFAGIFLQNNKGSSGGSPG